MRAASHTVLRFLLALAFMLAAMSAGVVLSSCGASDEDAIRASLSEELDMVKNLDESFVNEIVADGSVSDLSKYNVDVNEFVTQLLSGFDYEIQDVVVDGDTADATVVITMKSMTDLMNEFESSIGDLLADESLATLSESELYELISEALMADVTDLPLQEMNPVTITYNRVDGVWEPTDGSLSALEEAMMAS